MMRGPHGFRPGSDEKPKSTVQVALRLVRLLKPYTREISITVVLVILSAISQGLGPFLTGTAVDRFIIKGDAAGLTWVMLALLVVYIVGALATRWQVLLMAATGQKLLADLRQRLFSHIERLSLQYLESKQAGELMSRLVNDIDALNNFFSQKSDPDDRRPLRSDWNWSSDATGQLVIGIGCPYHASSTPFYN